MKKTAVICFLLPLLFFGKGAIGQNIGIGHNVAEGLLDINGDLVLRSGNLILTNGTSIAVDVESNPFSNYRITGPTNAFSVGGISASPDGKLLNFFNRSNHQMTIIHEHSGSDENNRILTGTGNDIEIPHNASISFTYNTIVQRWVVTGHSAPLPSSGQGSWITNDTRMYNTNVGNVGIGIQFPGYKLSVAGNGYFSVNSTALSFVPDQQGGNYITQGAMQLASPNTENYPEGIENNILALNGNQMQAYVRDINDGTSSDYVRSFSINPLGGNVGIGTSAPAAGAKMTIETADFSTVLQLRNKSNSVRFDAFLGGAANGNTVSLGTPGDMPMVFYTNSANRMMIAANGNIGIGTDQPSTKLQVQGSFKMTGAMFEPIRTIYGYDKTYNINPDDYNINVAVPSNYKSIIYFRLPNAAENTGRILKFSAESLPEIDVKYVDFINIISLSPSVQFENCTECPVLHKLYLIFPANHPTYATHEQVTCITIQSDGIAWRLTNTNYFSFHQPN